MLSVVSYSSLLDSRAAIFCMSFAVQKQRSLAPEKSPPEFLYNLTRLLPSTSLGPQRSRGREWREENLRDSPAVAGDHLLLGGGTEVLVNPIFLDEQQLKNCVFKWVMSTSAAAGGGGRAEDLRGGHHLLQRDWTMA